MSVELPASLAMGHLCTADIGTARHAAGIAYAAEGGSQSASSMKSLANIEFPTLAVIVSRNLHSSQIVG